jgi:hypothetical protein
MKRIHLLGLLFATTIFLGCASPSPEKPAASASSVTFSSADRAAITQYFDGYAKQLAKSSTAASYKAGDTLEPGQRPRKLPTDLAVRLSDPPQGYTRLIVGTDVILVNRENHRIADVIPNAAF